jgi:hypothetical protein
LPHAQTFLVQMGDFGNKTNFVEAWDDDEEDDDGSKSSGDESGDGDDDISKMLEGYYGKTEPVTKTLTLTLTVSPNRKP